MSLWADYTQIWKDYSNSDRNENVLLHSSKETRSKLMGAISYQPFRNFNALLGTHLLTVKDENQLKAVSEKHTSWILCLKVIGNLLSGCICNVIIFVMWSIPTLISCQR